MRIIDAIVRVSRGVVVAFAAGALICVLAFGASSVALAGECPNEQARAEQTYGLELPDCRAYELVSPVAKSDNSVSPVDSRAATSGEALVYHSPGSFGEPVSAAMESAYIARRGLGGWSTRNISPPYVNYKTNTENPLESSIFTPDLSEGILKSVYTPLVEGEAVGYINSYRANTENGSYQPITTFSPEDEHQPFEVGKEGEGVGRVEGASTDLSRVVFQEERSEGGLPRAEHVFEWSGGQPVWIDVPPPGLKFEGSSNLGAPAAFNQSEFTGNTWRAVSGDGSRVFFTAQESPALQRVGQLFVRLDPLAPQSPYVEGRCAVPGDACTVEVSASQRTNAKGEPSPDPYGPRPAFFRDASADGSRVFFTSRAELTNDAYTGPEDNAANLYEYDVETGVLTDLTVATNGESPDGAAVLGLVNAGEDGAYVYFVANGVLAEGAKPGNCRVEEGEPPVGGERSCSLYVVHEDAGVWEAPRFIATLAGSNAHTFSSGEVRNDQVGDEGVWAGYETGPETTLDHDFGPGWHSARVSADGGVLAFESELSLTGFDNAPPVAGACGAAGRCREVYMYQAESGRLSCVSCDPSLEGRAPARPVGLAELGGHEDLAPSFAAAYPFYLPWNLSAAGDRLFFESPDALVVGDGNGVRDVYEWELAGVGSCTEVSVTFTVERDGCVFPVSNVAGGQESRFMDASANGDDVFFATGDRLLSSDTDTRVDVYDARVGGGFSVSVSQAPCVNADSCKPPVSPQPSLFGAPASATFSGLGNVVPGPAAELPTAGAGAVKKAAAKKKTVKCKRGFVRKRGRCVRKAARSSRKRAGRGRSGGRSRS